MSEPPALIDEVRDFHAGQPYGRSYFWYHCWHWIKGGVMERIHADKRLGTWRWGGNDLDEPLFDEGVEFGEVELDVARSRVWTKELEAANQKWYRCKRKNGNNDIGACFEEGELVRRENWRHQLQIRESGCEEHWFRYAKCLQRGERKLYLCVDLEDTFQQCLISAGNMNLLPDVPTPLKRDRIYTGFMPRDIRQYRMWIKRRDKFLSDHPNWFAEEDIENMDATQLFDFVQKKQPWTEAGDRKPYSTYQLPMRYREFIPDRDLV